MSSDSDDENIIRYGTPLEPYEEDEIPSKRKFQQQPDQYAVDAHGRRRFHGAFTGGFSAGFGNTVGSQEGWTPSSFKSSRSEKAQFSGHKAEDFMDEEDRSEFGIAPRHMQTQNEFSGRKRPQQNRFHDGPIPGEPVLETLVRAVHETAAVRMLRAMGWREGQGVGGRVTREEKRKARQQHKVYGCYMPEDVRQTIQNQDEDSTDSEFDYDTLFAPDDYEPYVLNQKNDRFGLGYSGLSRHSVLGNLTGEYGEGSSKSHLVMKDKGKRVSIRGQAFGVGAFEADDEDIYATEDMSHYDFTLGGASSHDKKAQAKKPASNILVGFVKSSAPMPGVPSYPPPALPRDYVPARAGVARTRFEPTTVRPRDQGLGRHDLTAEARGNLLGEVPVPRPKTPETSQKQKTPPTQDPAAAHKKQKTPPKDKEDPIAKLLGRNVNFVSNNEDFISIKDSGKELVKVFRPFSQNPKKQARYEMYCKDKNVVLESDGDRLSEWERDRELMEFEQAAKLYRPLTGEMGDRFTHASQPDEALNPLTAVAKSNANYGIATKEQMEAAERGVYGVMTRKQDIWRPEALVCKRFNVPQPYLDRPEPAKEDKPKISYSIFSYLESSVHDRESFTKEQSKFSGSKSLGVDNNQPSNSKNAQKIYENSAKDTIVANKDDTTSTVGFKKRMTVAEMFMNESEKDKKQGVETDTIDKFDKMDLYKSIFLSDSEDDEGPKVDDEKADNANDFVDVPKNVERNLSPPRGIFANIDFEEINSWRTVKRDVNKTETDKGSKKMNEKTVENNITDKGLNEADLYGPKIPDNLKARLEAKEDAGFQPVFRKRDERGKETQVVEIESSSSDSWIEAKETKSKKQKKKNKKHKSKHKKSKHKKKDR